MPSGMSVRTVAAWLYSRMDSANRASANSHGAAVTRSEMEPSMNSELPLKNVSPIHAIPKMAMTAVIPDWNTLPFTTSSAFGRQTIMMTAAMTSMTISMVMGIDMRVSSPSTVHAGRSVSTEPNRTTSTAPSKNSTTAILEAVVGT